MNIEYSNKQPKARNTASKKRVACLVYTQIPAVPPNIVFLVISINKKDV